MEVNKIFETLNKIDVSEHIEEKNKLKYLSWAWAWSELKKQYPTASYKILRFENNLPYVYDNNTGYMVFTEMTINEITHEMWLPVMDGANKAMKNISYKYKTHYGEKTVEPATMFDINKTIMRCLVKNIAMFGLGLYIYAGEDLPDVPEEMITKEQIEKIDSLGIDKIALCKFAKVKSINELTKDKAEACINKKLEQMQVK